MLTYKNGSNSAILVLHEIYGINKHIINVCEEYFSSGYDVYCPDLLSGYHFDYLQQEEAYSYFMENVGFEAHPAVTELLQQLRPNYGKIILMGFSVGATIAWRCADSGLCDCMIGYYGSRIRDYPDIEPRCPSLLIFANSEKLFDAVRLAKVLEHKRDVTVKVLKGSHGFCDPFCKSFHPVSARAAKKLTERFLRENNPDL